MNKTKRSFTKRKRSKLNKTKKTGGIFGIAPMGVFKKVDPDAKTWGILRKKSDNRKMYEQFKEIMIFLVLIYYDKFKKIPNEWTIVEMDAVKDDPRYQKYLNNIKFNQKGIEYIDKILKMKKKEGGNKYWCRMRDLERYERLYCNMGWNRDDYIKVMKQISYLERIPRDIFNKLDGQDIVTLCGALNANFGNKASKCVHHGEFFQDHEFPVFKDNNVRQELHSAYV